MNTYRSTQTIQAVQFTGDPIPDVTCGGSDAEVQVNGCDSSRKQHTHVHANVTGGMVVLKPGDWIFPVQGGPWGAVPNAKFRAHWEVPEPVPAPAAEVAPSEPVAFPETPATPPVDVAVVPAAEASAPEVAAEPVAEVPAEPAPIPVPEPHTIAEPDVAQGEGLVVPVSEPTPEAPPAE